MKIPVCRLNILLERIGLTKTTTSTRKVPNLLKNIISLISKCKVVLN